MSANDPKRTSRAGCRVVIPRVCLVGHWQERWRRRLVAIVPVATAHRGVGPIPTELRGRRTRRNPGDSYAQDGPERHARDKIAVVMLVRPMSDVTIPFILAVMTSLIFASVFMSFLAFAFVLFTHLDHQRGRRTE